MGQVDAHSIIRRFTRAGLLILLALPASAQVARKCSGRVYDSREVSKHARIIEGPKLNVGLLGPIARARFVLEAVLCRNGHVTDIRVVEGMSPEINEFAIAAVSLVKFEPAEHRWHSVSQRMRFELQVGPNEPGMKVSVSADAGGRLIESVDIIGHRRLTTKQILSWIKIRPGDPYREESLKRDFEALLATGYFDKTQTRAMIENGVRGGIIVTFEVVELPVIGTVEFKGLRIDRAIVFEALKKKRINLKPGTTYNAEAVKAAVHLIKRLHDETGSEFTVETEFEQVTAMTVNITFVITPNQ